jgi:hypothetical protein
MRMRHTQKILRLIDAQPFVHYHRNPILPWLSQPLRHLREFKIHPVVLLSP